MVESRLKRAELRKKLLSTGWDTEAIDAYLQSTQPTQETILRIHGISKQYGGNPVIDTIDFDVKPGEIFGIIGMSGAGKTTLLNIMAGFITPDRGDILFTGKETYSITRNPEQVSTHIGFSTQQPSFYPKLTVLENLEHFGTLYGLHGRDLQRRARNLLKLVGLDEHRHKLSGNLSGGMQKRLDIACALVHDPQILFLDEPTSDLDPVMRKHMWQLIREINMKGTTVILASHFLAEIELLCTRIAVLFNHAIINIGTGQELRTQYSKKYRIELETKTREYPKIKTLGKYNPTIKNGILTLEASTPEDVLGTLSKIAKQEKLTKLTIERPSLGHMFEVLLKK